MQSEIMKRIRSADRGMRGKFKGFPLFQVTFKDLKEADDTVQQFVLDWYENLTHSEPYVEFHKSWKESRPEVWERLRANASHLPEYQNLLYLKSIFVAYCKQTMPEIIIYKDPRRIK